MDLISEGNHEELDIEEIFQRIGGFGRFQKIMIAMGMFIAMSTCYHSTNLYFVAYDPPWKCKSDNITLFCSEHVGQEFNSDNEDCFKQRCKMNRTDWSYTISRKSSIVTEVIDYG